MREVACGPGIDIVGGKKRWKTAPGMGGFLVGCAFLVSIIFQDVRFSAGSVLAGRHTANLGILWLHIAAIALLSWRMTYLG